MNSRLQKSTLVAPTAPPPLAAYPRSVQKLIKRLRTPKLVQAWLRSLDYNKDETMHTLPGVVRRGRAHCLEGSLCAAAILEHHGPAQHERGAPRAGYPPLILDLESTDLLDHTLFLYRRNGRYGSVGKSRDVGLDGRKPVFRTIEALVKSYAAPYIDANACLTGFGVLDLRTLTRSHWRTSTKSVWYVESALHQTPHYKLHLAPTFIRHWRRRFVRFKTKHPDKQPNYFPHQSHWI